MQGYKETEEGRRKISNKGQEKMRNIPGSIYLPRKHFPTKQKYQQETAERDNREDRLKHTEELLIVFL